MKIFRYLKIVSMIVGIIVTTLIGIVNFNSIRENTRPQTQPNPRSERNSPKGEDLSHPPSPKTWFAFFNSPSIIKQTE